MRYCFDGCGKTLTCGTACDSGKTCVSNKCIVKINLTTYVYPAITNNKILPNTTISDNYKSDKISISAAKGEYEPASFVIKSDQDIYSLIVEPTALVGSAGTIPVKNVDVKWTKVWWQAGVEIADISHKQLTPELLLNDNSLVSVRGSDNYLKLSNGKEANISNPNGVFVGNEHISNVPTISEFPVKDSATFMSSDLPKNYNQQFWVTVKVPENISDGTYTGKILFKSGTQTIKELTLAVSVWPFKLSDPKLEYSIYTMTYLTSNYSDGTIGANQNEQQYRASLKDLFDHGIINPMFDNEFFNVLNLHKEAGMSNDVIYYHNILAKDQTVEELKKFKQDASTAGVKELYVYLPDEDDLTTPANQELIKKSQ